MACAIHGEGCQSHLSGKGWLSKIGLVWLLCWGMSPKKLGVSEDSTTVGFNYDIRCVSSPNLK
jgi:hypothetical protein